jgi:subtilase family serine protease
MKKKKKLIMAATAGLAVLLLSLLFVIPALAAVNVGSRNTINYFDYNGGSGWKDLKTPEHYIVGSSPEQIAYCLQHKNDSPSNSPYNETDILGSYSSRVQTGLRIILENGYPYATGGLSASEARYATANAIRFWLSENGDSSQYNFTDLGSYSDAQLRSAAAAGQIGNKIRANSGYTDVLQFSIELLIKARSQALMAHDIYLSTPSMYISGSYFIGTSTVSLVNMNGGYDLNTSGLPAGSSVTGYTGGSGDVLTIRIPLSEANANRSFSLSATGQDNRTRSNMFAYAPNNSSLQRVIVAKPAVYNDAKTAATTVSTPQIYADLIVTALNANSSSYDAGDTITITATIQNQGLRSAGGFYVSLTSADLPTQAQYVSSLSAGASTNVSFTYTAPQYGTNKSVTVTATADSTGAIPESNESNNTRSTSFTVRSLPDLIVSALSPDKTQYLPGETISIAATVRNQGSVSASGFSVSLTSANLATQTKYVASLAAGTSVNVTFTYTAPQLTSSTAITVTATADSSGAVAETDEGNNTRSVSFTVLALPDLTVASLTGDKPAYEAGETVTISATLKNIGPTTSAATTVRLTVPNIGTYSKNVSTLAAGASQTVRFTFTAPTALTPQNITVTATVDPENLVQESNESNNTRTATVAVNALRPDIEVTDSTITDWYAGMKVTVSATIRNRTAQLVPSVAIRLSIGGVNYTENIPIAGNGSNLAVFRVTVPASGNYTVRVTADPEAMLNETDESNNVLTKDIQVKAVPASLVADPDDTGMAQRYSVYGLMGVPSITSSAYHTWQEVRLEAGSYVTKNYWAKLTTTFSISPDSRIAYDDKPRVIESGFGYSVSCSTVLTTNYDHPEKLVGAQMVWMRCPESAYGQLSQWQDVRDSLAAKTGNPGDTSVTWQFKVNPWSVTGSRLHYIPIWFPDGDYTAWAQAFYAWSPVGQLFEFKTDSLTIDGDMYDRITTIQQR